MGGVVRFHSFTSTQFRAIVNHLKSRGVPLATNQVEYSLVRRYPEVSKLMQECAILGVRITAFSPLAMGRLTGKYSISNPPPEYLRFGKQPIAEIQKILDRLEGISKANNKTIVQNALTLCDRKGSDTCCWDQNSRTYVLENVGALGWKLSTAEIAALDGVSLQGSMNHSWQHS
eukprot:c9841_g1_i6.p1 GENE.c9841_g1_i6~~c9841_g1_i6.p1  ORF type:complete len:174 (+),score=38.99 c9841_g1_i6:1-522(+)